MAGLATTENFAALRAKNFGVRSLTGAITVEGLVEQVRRYDCDDARQVAEQAQREADLERQLDTLDALYAQVIAAAATAPVSREAHDAAVARFLHAYLPRRQNDPRWPGRQALDERIAELEGRLADAAEAEVALRREVADANRKVTASEERLAAISRSRLLSFGRWLRRIRGLPDPLG
jgi:uncharacterized coiled-coil protein SlyX